MTTKYIKKVFICHQENAKIAKRTNITKIKDRLDQMLMKMWSKCQHSQAAGGNVNLYNLFGKLMVSTKVEHTSDHKWQ